MKIVGHIPQTNVEEDVEAEDATEAVRKFKELHPHALVELIDEEVVVGFCEGCERPIMESEEGTFTYNSEDSVYLCQGCTPDDESRNRA